MFFEGTKLFYFEMCSQATRLRNLISAEAGLFKLITFVVLFRIDFCYRFVHELRLDCLIGFAVGGVGWITKGAGCSANSKFVYVHGGENF